MKQPSVREPAVAGMFYPGTPDRLDREVRTLTHPEAGSTPQHEMIGGLVPHAGYVYSGAVAGGFFAHARLPQRLIVLGPNHTGLGAAVAVSPHTAWRTPLGDEPVDAELAEWLCDEFPPAELDARAHRHEHSIEVQLPFLQVARPDGWVLPVCVRHLSLADCLRLGDALARVVEHCEQPVGLLASSDLSHYEPDHVARQHDRQALEPILRLDPTGLYETVHRNGISMCGVIATTVMLAACRRLGARRAHEIAYATSGDVTGERAAVVGYASVCVHADS